MPLHIKIMSWALIFILRLRFLPGKSIATSLLTVQNYFNMYKFNLSYCISLSTGNIFKMSRSALLDLKNKVIAKGFRSNKVHTQSFVNDSKNEPPNMLIWEESLQMFSKSQKFEKKSKHVFITFKDTTW